MTKQDKQKVELALELGQERILQEQDFHCSRTDEMEKVGNQDYLETLQSIQWKGICDAMKHECSPATDQDRAVIPPFIKEMILLATIIIHINIVNIK